MKFTSAVSLCSLALPLTFAVAIDDTQIPFVVPEDAVIDDIPSLGFGTWNLDPKNASDVVSTAIKTGYRHIDCAAAYSNEESVGKGIAAGLEDQGLKRRDIWVTSKLWNTHHRPDLVAEGLDETLSDLGLDYLDLYLMHWPVTSNGSNNTIDYLPTWAAMTELPKSKVRHIGISNFSPAQLAALLAEFPLNKPYNHQFELHPYLPQDAWLATNLAAGIKVTAYSPLGNMNPTYTNDGKGGPGTEVPALLENVAVTSIAASRNCTPAQVSLAWGRRRGYAVIPKSKQEAHIEENFAVKETCVLDEDAATLKKILPVKRFNNPSRSWGVKLYEGLEDSKAVDVLGIMTKVVQKIEWLMEAFIMD